MGSYSTGKEVDVVVGTTLTTLFELSCLDSQSASAHFINAAGGENLNVFQIQAAIGQGNSWFILYDVPGAFLQPNGLLVASSGDLVNLPTGFIGWFILDVGGFSAIRCQAAVGANTTTLTVRATANN